MNRAGYAALVLKHGRWPVTEQSIMALVTVMVAEGSSAVGNPLDTTERWSGSSPYNNAGVQNYPTCDAGAQAVVATLTNGDYPGVVAALSQPNATGVGAEGIVTAFAASPWGTWSAPGPALADLRTVRADWPAAGDVEVAGPDGVSSPPPTPTPASEGDAMIAADPTSKGLWVARPNGAVYAYGGAPYLGGLNNHPQWHRGGAGQPQCVGICHDPATGGYALAVDAEILTQPEVYRFPRTAVYA